MSSSRSAKYLFEGLEPRQLLTTFNPADGASLTAILNRTNSGTKLALGDTIILNAGATYTAGMVLPNLTTGSGWVTIESSNVLSLPAAGVRVSPSDASNMPKVISPGGNTPDVDTASGAHHFKFIGIEFIGYIADKSDGTSQTFTTIMQLGHDSSLQTTVAQEPNHIIVDRCYFHPDVYTRQVRRAIALHGAYIDVTNCYIEEIHEGSDSNAIAGWNGSGPYNIINNHLEGAGENIIFGGATQAVPTTDTQVVIRGNDVVKPLYWLLGYYKDPSHPYPSTYLVNSSTTKAFPQNFKGNYGPLVKNLLELKEGSHFVVEGNTFENVWVSAQDGGAILFKLGDYNDSYNADGGINIVDEDIIFKNNIVEHAAHGVTFQGRDYAASNPSDPGGLVRRFTISNNLWNDISPTGKDANGYYPWGGTQQAQFAYLLYGPKNVSFDHNTIFDGYTPVELDTSTGSSLLTWPSPNFMFTNNIVEHNGGYGFHSSAYAWGDATIYNVIPDSTVKGNVFMNDAQTAAGSYDNNAFPAGSNNYPRVRYNNFWPTTANTGFVDYANGNYALTPSASSSYINGTQVTDTQDGNIKVLTKTTDGKAPGVDFDVLNGATAGDASGVWQFAYVSGGRLFIHFDGSGTPISLSVSGSNYVVSEAGQTTLTVAISGITGGINVVDSTSDDTLQISGAVSPALIQPTNTSGNDLISLSGGTFNFASDLSLGSQYWNVNNWGVYVASTATASFASSQHLRSLSVDGTVNQNDSATTDGTTGTTNTVLDLGDLQVSGNGKLDLKDNDLVWDYSTTSPMGAWANGSYAQGLVTLIKNGRNRSGNGTLGQLFSSNTTAGDFSNTVLGVREASSASNLDAKTFTTFDGVSLDSTAVLVKYTYAADANLSGKIDGDDYFSMDSGFAARTGYFANGDLNLDGKINADDYFLIDSTLNKQGSPL